MQARRLHGGREKHPRLYKPEHFRSNLSVRVQRPTEKKLEEEGKQPHAEGEGEKFISERIENGEPFSETLADAVTAYPIPSNAHAHAIHAYVSKVYLERNARVVRDLRVALTRLVSHHPPDYRNATWPGGLRNDPGLAPPAPDSRFDHLRWTRFNNTHALMPDEHRAAAPLASHHAHALQAVLHGAWAWLGARFPHLTPAGLVEGARRWVPAYGLTYLLLLRLARPDGVLELRQLEIVKPLGRARLLALPYVTESARIAMLVPVLKWNRADLADALDFLHHYEATCLGRDHKTSLLIALAAIDNVTVDSSAPAAVDELRRIFASLTRRHGDARLELVDVPLPADAETRRALDESDLETLRTRSTRAALARLPIDSLVLVLPPHVDYNEEFLNRVRMNTIAGVQAFAPMPFARFAQYEHPQFVDAAGNKPTVNTGRFHSADTRLLSFYRRDYDAAMSVGGDDERDTLAALVKSALHVLRAPEPGLVLRPRPAPCPVTASVACLRRLQRTEFAELNLGARHTLAKLLLETEDARAHV
ncbi:Chondroitin sulfate synthase 2 [Eumeta japonica]|uniref:Hexosyltransferase n=1 Tax=Eumeta variegata TaxID=151549 RepID=A0A4C1TQW4_EUMVA|nr:Chondroitin sulfate synthase 2 [Eumeta japonica]